MESHVRILAWLHIILGFVGGLVAIVVLVVFGGIATLVAAAGADHNAHAAVPVLVLVGLAVSLLILILAAPQVITGVGLLRFRPWGRILGIVISVFSILNIGLGTLLGIYGLWVLLQPETERLFAASR